MHCKKVAHKVTSKWMKMRRLTGREWGYSRQELKTLYKGVAEPVVTSYGRGVHSAYPELTGRCNERWVASTWVTQTLTGHGCCRQYLHKFNHRDTAICVCGQTDTMTHKVYQCELSDRIRWEIRQEMAKEYVPWPHMDTFFLKIPAHRRYIEKIAKTILKKFGEK